MNLAAWLGAMVTPLLGRILVSLGFSVVTITGFNLVIAELRDMVVASTGGLGADVLNLFLIAGGGTALGIIFGAISVRVMLFQIQQSTKILGVNPG